MHETSSDNLKDMKYIFISTSYQPEGSVYQYFKALGDEFVKHDFSVVYIFDQLLEVLPSNSKNKSFLSWPSKRPTKLKDFIFLGNLIKKYKPQYCIAVFGSVNTMMLASYFYSVNGRIAWVRTTQTQILKDSNNPIKSKLLAFRKSFIYSLATQIITNSEGTKKDSILNFGINPKKITALSNLKQKTLIKNKPRVGREFSLIVVGRLDESKGHRILFKQFKNVVNKYPNLKLKVLGTGILLNQLKEDVNNLQLKENIIFLGKVDSNLIGQFFSECLIGISSSFSEAFGWVNIESLNEGTPIISTETEGGKDILVPGLNGEFFYHNQETSLLNAIDLILNNWNKYSLGAVDTFDNNFNIQNQIKKHTKKILKHK